MTAVLPTPRPSTDGTSTPALASVRAHTDTATVAERLMAEFEGRVGLAEVTRVVHACWLDLSRAGAEPEAEVLESESRLRLSAVGAG